ncbi:hypothetical protein [Eleftheria terrae]|uniref:hypothetical protein n=1 Tax=Eleftheria terrae TaxID=1597781 RepID=UPI00263B420B|nr:hypothetical protein [Eleftheria terrae]WKB52989.1 hypothetical protein N7L95_00880 [Eleftheria terrae]
MSTTKHTPGPWHWVEQQGTQMPMLKGANGRVIMDFGDCERYYPTEGNGPDADNARLIAAAPEMLQGLEDMLQHFTSFLRACEMGEEAIDVATRPYQRLIAKAKGIEL